MEKKVVLLFDCEKGNNDKEWLAQELSKDASYHFVALYPTKHIPALWINRHKIKACSQIIRLLRLANKEINMFQGQTIVICWSIATSMLAEFFLSKRAIVFSLNWLTPDNRIVNTSIRRRIIKDNRFYLFADQKGTRQIIMDYYGIKNPNKIGVFPDTFSGIGDSISIDKSIVEKRRTERICFTGGLNNRNWALLYQVAKGLPDVHFIAIGCPKDMNTPRLMNLTAINRTSSQEYYRLMASAYIVYLPLNDLRAAGAINIYRASKNHQICLITNTPSTAPYFPIEYSENLIPSPNIEENISLIKAKFELTNQDYIKEVLSIRRFLEDNYSSEKVAKILVEMIHQV